MVIKNYIEQTYAAWLGKIIGIRMGSPIEGWDSSHIEKIYGDFDNYLVDYKDYAADDDSNGPLFFSKVVDDYGISPKEKNFSDVWLNYAIPGRGFFWWGGYGISTENTAYCNIENGIHSPKSGSIELNGHAVAEQIGGQIFIDYCGYLFPNDYKKAAQFAKLGAQVSHDGNGIYGAMFIAACISKAYSTKKISEIIQAGLEVIPKDSDYSIMVNDITTFYNNDKEKKWKNCLNYVKDKYSYSKYAGFCHIIPNSAVIVASLFYGNGEFEKTMLICNKFGWDTDCNAGNVGSIIGLVSGLENINFSKWGKPINDLMLASSSLGSLNISTLSENVEEFCKKGIKLLNLEVEDNWQKILANKNLVAHFEIPTSTHAFRILNPEKNEADIFNCDEFSVTGKRSLKIHFNSLSNYDSEGIFIYKKTYYEPSDLHDNRYDPSFSPIAYSGDEITATIINPEKLKVKIALYAKDINNNIKYFGEYNEIKITGTKISYTIPSTEGSCIKEVGINIVNYSEVSFQGNIYLDSFEIISKPNYSIDFSKEKKLNYGHSGHIGGPHLEISQFTYHNGHWEIQNNYLRGSCSKEARLVTGHHKWENYIFTANLTPQIGENHGLIFKVQGCTRYYSLMLEKNNKVTLLKKENDEKILKSAQFDWKTKVEYELKIETFKNKMKLYINSKFIFEYEDEDNFYENGGIGVLLKDGSVCHYKNITIKNIN